MQRISDVLQGMQARGTQKREYIPDWRKNIPPGSRWFPGCPGKPECKQCEGTGYVRLDVPVGNENFGKIFLCDCAKV